jgi:hypothetical protein
MFPENSGRKQNTSTVFYGQRIVDRREDNKSQIELGLINSHLSITFMLQNVLDEGNTIHVHALQPCAKIFTVLGLSLVLN